MCALEQYFILRQQHKWCNLSFETGSLSEYVRSESAEKFEWICKCCHLVNSAALVRTVYVMGLIMTIKSKTLKTSSND